MRNRVEEIKSKGFNIVQGRQDTDFQQNTGYAGLPAVDFAKIKVGAKMLDDAVFNLGDYQKVNPRLADKKTVLRAIDNYDVKTMREISDFFYKTSGIYSRLVRYMAFMYRYDWYITPYRYGKDKVNEDKMINGFYSSLQLLDNFNVKKTFGEIALTVLRHGSYYGYVVKQGNNIVLQELDSNYCRSRFSHGGRPAVEFNMKFFDDYFRDTTQRIRMLKLFPDEFSKGYNLYKQGKLPPAFSGDTSGWYLLDPSLSVKFTVNGEDHPAFISVIPLILDLDEAQALDRKKTMQKLLKIVIQKMPVDKNGDLIFDVEEAQQLHNNAVQMLGRAIGVDVLTTFADVTVEDMQDSQASAQTDDLERVERQLYNEAGVSQMQFNTDGNIALEKSILNDEATMYNMLLQFEQFLNELVVKFGGKQNKVIYKVQMLTTTIYNYKELSKLFKEQTQIGYSKMLPQIALGQSQSSILANAYFENEVLDLASLFVPPAMSSTMSGNPGKGGSAGEKATDKNKGSNKAAVPAEDKKVGRKEKADDEKSEKTIQNKESMS